MRRAQGTTARIPVALFGGKSLRSFFRVANVTAWNRSLLHISFLFSGAAAL
jgi:hypothetical protein